MMRAGMMRTGMMRTGMMLVVLVGCDSDDLGDPLVSVQRYDAAADCFATVAGTPAPSADLKLPACPDAETNAAVVAGIDRLRFVIDFGAGFDLSDGTVLDKPTFSITHDAAPSTVAARFDPMQPMEGHVYFLATYDVPLAAAGTRLQATAELSTDRRPVSAPISIAIPEPSLRIEQCTADPCSMVGGIGQANVVLVVPATREQMVTLSSRLDGISRDDARVITTAVEGPRVTRKVISLDVPFVDRAVPWTIRAQWLTSPVEVEVKLVAPSIALEVEQCTDSPCSLVGGVGRANVVLTVAATREQMVTLSSRLGVISRDDARVITTPVVEPGLTRKLVPLDVPFVDEPTRWTIHAQWQTLSRDFEIDLARPSIALELEQCPSFPCTRDGGVGQMRAIVTVPGEAPQTVTVRTRLNGATEEGTQTITTSTVGTLVTRGAVNIPVPFAPDRSSWQLIATWHTIEATHPEPITLVAPLITASIGCGSPCFVTAGSTVQLAIGAPKDIRTGNARFETFSDTAPDVDGVITTSTVDGGATRTWRTQLTAPTTPGTRWKIQSDVGGYPADTITATIVP